MLHLAATTRLKGKWATQVFLTMSQLKRACGSSILDQLVMLHVGETPGKLIIEATKPRRTLKAKIVREGL